MLNFENNLPTVPKSDECLFPLFHSPLDKHLKQILNDKRLKSSDNIFLFYGRPSYCLSHGNKVLRRFCFIVHFDNKISVDKVFPFDSGGFKSNRYNKFEIANYGIANFLIKNIPESIRSMVHAFYGENINYFNCKPLDEEVTRLKSQIHIDYFKFINRNLLRDGVQDIPIGIDIISHSIEVQACQDVLLNESSIAIIVPEHEFAQNKKIRDLEKDGIEVLRYSADKAGFEKSARENIFRKSHEFIKKQNMLVLEQNDE